MEENGQGWEFIGKIFNVFMCFLVDFYVFLGYSWGYRLLEFEEYEMGAHVAEILAAQARTLDGRIAAQLDKTKRPHKALPPPGNGNTVRRYRRHRGRS